jgi:diguanylate cyclase (GGDEF)-like protein
LVIIKGEELGRRIDLDDEIVEIGRSEECSITIDSELVSRRHAVVQRVAGNYIVADLQSTNGTYVNSERVTTRGLNDGDKISIGKTVLKYMESNLELHYHEQLFTMVSVDPLTGAYNKRFFEEALAKEAAKSSQARSELCLVLFDVDHFKRINDGYGHPAGDEVLRSVAAAVKQSLAGIGLARVGGEEFAFMLPGASLAAGRLRAEAVRRLVETTPFRFGETVIPVTISLGVAEQKADEDAAKLYQRADAQLYEAKRSGRNRVC